MIQKKKASNVTLSMSILSEKELRKIVYEEAERAIKDWQTNKAAWLKH
jgi:hypothetical protein